jgi:hypothetical protein
VKLYFDEDTGGGVPRALREVVKNPQIEYPRANGLVAKGTFDITWIPRVTEAGYIIFSCNKHILDSQVEVETIVSNNAGVVFLDSGQETAQQVLTLVLNEWNWLEDLYRNHPRPFTYLISIKGRKRFIDPVKRLRELGESP